MKTPPRKFVVEFKSGRRLPKSEATSIWGGTDLKALAREVEDQSSHLFGDAKTAVQEVTEPAPGTGVLMSADGPVVEDIAPEPPTNPMSAFSLGSTPAAIDKAAEPAPIPIEPPTVAKIDEVAEPVRTPIEAPTLSKTVKAPKMAPRKRVARAAPTSVPAVTVEELQLPPSSGATASACLDDLATLDAENKRLRQLLANQLRAQNAELKRMLERF